MIAMVHRVQAACQGNQRLAVRTLPRGTLSLTPCVGENIPMHRGAHRTSGGLRDPRDHGAVSQRQSLAPHSPGTSSSTWGDVLSGPPAPTLCPVVGNGHPDSGRDLRGRSEMEKSPGLLAPYAEIHASHRTGLR